MNQPLQRSAPPNESMLQMDEIGFTSALVQTKYPVRRTVNITQEMEDKLHQILTKQDRSYTQQDLYRAALRQYIDDQEDVIGSRRHFSKSLQRRLDLMEFKHVFYLDILI